MTSDRAGYRLARSRKGVKIAVWGGPMFKMSLLDAQDKIIRESSS
jgi:hypothetical protein